jgi:hypothetical protein
MLGYDVLHASPPPKAPCPPIRPRCSDDDKDGAYTASDGANAAGTYIGPSYVAAGDAPQIGDGLRHPGPHGRTTASLWIGGVSSVYPISRGLVPRVQPGHDPTADIPVTDLRAWTWTTTRTRAATRSPTTLHGPRNLQHTFYVQDEEGQRFHATHRLHRHRSASTTASSLSRERKPTAPPGRPSTT